MSNVSQLPNGLNISDLHIHCAENRKLCALSQIAQDILDDRNPLIALNGVRVTMHDGWWMVRAAANHPSLIVRAQSASEAGMVRLKQDLANHLDDVCLDFPLSLFE